MAYGSSRFVSTDVIMAVMAVHNNYSDGDIFWKRAQEIVYEKKKIPGRDEEASETEAS